MSSVDPLKSARELFMAYDGSRFYMSRDGVEEQYQRYEVPRDVEATWLEELTACKLRRLPEPGNWKVVYFLVHHSDTRHFRAVVATQPLGEEFWQRCSYLETLLRYIQLCANSYPLDEIRSATDTLVSSAHHLDPAPADQPPNRVERLIQEATAYRSTLPDEP